MLLRIGIAAAAFLAVCILPFAAPESTIRLYVDTILSAPISPYSDSLVRCADYQVIQLRTMAGYSGTLLLGLVSSIVLMASYVRHARKGIAQGEYCYGGPRFRWGVRLGLAMVILATFVFATPISDGPHSLGCAAEYTRPFRFVLTTIGFGALVALVRTMTSFVKRF